MLGHHYIFLFQLVSISNDNNFHIFIPGTLLNSQQRTLFEYAYSFSTHTCKFYSLPNRVDSRYSVLHNTHIFIQDGYLSFVFKGCIYAAPSMNIIFISWSALIIFTHFLDGLSGSIYNLYNGEPLTALHHYAIYLMGTFIFESINIVTKNFK